MIGSLAHWLTDKQREFSTDWGMLAALDAHGEVIWYYRSDFRTAGIARLANGNVLMRRTDFSTAEIDLLWPGYQHNPRMTHAGTVILFDNRAHGGASVLDVND